LIIDVYIVESNYQYELSMVARQMICGSPYSFKFALPFCIAAMAVDITWLPLIRVSRKSVYFGTAAADRAASSCAHNINDSR
jgi:hypothetical protein